MTSRLLQLSLICGLCAVSAGIGFRMGAPTARPPLVAALVPPQLSPLRAPGTPASAVAAAEHAYAMPSASAMPLSQSQTAALAASTDPTASSVAMPAPAAAKTNPRLRTSAISRAPARISVPLVFREIDPAALGLTAVQIADIDRMRSSFTEQVGQQNPADPTYRQRWASAQPESDEQLRTYLGWEMFNKYQIEAARMQ